MRIKSAARYQIYDYIRVIRIYYLFVIGLILLMLLGSAVLMNTGYFTLGGLDFITCLSLFIVGLLSFKESFLMMLQNSISRKTMFISRLISMAAAGVFAALIDRAIIFAGGILNKMNENLLITGIYDTRFEERKQILSSLAFNTEALLITMFLYFSISLFGYFISAAFYRMSKAVKSAVLIGFSSLIILLPMLDSSIFGRKIGLLLSKVIYFIMGGDKGSPYNLLISCILSMAVCSGLSWLIIRKAVEKR